MWLSALCVLIRRCSECSLKGETGRRSGPVPILSSESNGHLQNRRACRGSAHIKAPLRTSEACADHGFQGAPYAPSRLPLVPCHRQAGAFAGILSFLDIRRGWQCATVFQT